jgi:hypothetical protein
LSVELLFLIVVRRSTGFAAMSLFLLSGGRAWRFQLAARLQKKDIEEKEKTNNRIDRE